MSQLALRQLRIAVDTPLSSHEAMLAEESAIPYDDDGNPIVRVATCGECGQRWNDAAISFITPAPSARCPFECDHES